MLKSVNLSAKVGVHLFELLLEVLGLIVAVSLLISHETVDLFL